MKFRMIVLAAMAAAGSANAAIITPAALDTARANGTLKEIRIFGASAQSTFVGAYMQSICKSTDFTTYFDTTAGANHRAYACTLAKKVGNYAIGTTVFVNKREAGGSIYGVNPVATASAQNAMQVKNGACVATGLTPSVTTAAYTCGTVALEVPTAGISDVEPDQFGKKVTVNGNANVFLNLPTTLQDDGVTPWTALTPTQIAALDTAAINQTIFGVAVNLNLRNALQQAQGLVVGSDAAVDQPSMPRAFYTAAISGFVKGGSANATWRTLTGIAGDEAKQVNICRRANGSGTQASSNLFFLQAATIPTDVNGMLAPLTAQGAVAANGTLAVVENTSTGAVETCLTSPALGTTGYAMGIISLERDPGTKAYRFVKLDGAAPLKSLARVGAYPYVYAATMQWLKTGGPDTDQRAFLAAFRTQAGSPAVIDTLPDAATKNGVMANPRSYTGNCASATGVNLAHGSCVERLDFASAFNVNKYINGSAAAAFKTNSNQSLHIVK